MSRTTLEAAIDAAFATFRGDDPATHGHALPEFRKTTARAIAAYLRARKESAEEEGSTMMVALYEVELAELSAE